MKHTTASLPAPTAQCLPFAQASPQQITQALLYLQSRVPTHFPTLSWGSWANRLLEMQPDLWLTGDGIALAEDDLRDLVQRLAESPEMPDSELPLHGPRAAYLARKLVNYEDDAIHALTEIEAYPTAHGPLVYRLIVSLALGNAVADEVFRVTNRGPWGRPGGPGRDVARATVQERLQTLRCARREGEYGHRLNQPVSPARSGRSRK